MIIASTRLFAIALVLLLTSCIGSGTVQILTQDYTDTKLYNTSITLLPLTEDIVDEQLWKEHIALHPESISATNQRNKELFQRYFSSVFEDVTTASVVDGLDEKNVRLSVPLTDVSLPIDEKKALHFLVPDKAPALLSDTLKTAFTLFVQSLNWKVEYGESTNQTVGRASSGSYEVAVGFQYVLWNNTKKEIVAYGKLTKKSQYLQIPSKTTYIEILEELCRQLVTKSPLQEKTQFG